MLFRFLSVLEAAAIKFQSGGLEQGRSDFSLPEEAYDSLLYQRIKRRIPLPIPNCLLSSFFQGVSSEGLRQNFKSSALIEVSLLSLGHAKYEAASNLTVRLSPLYQKITRISFELLLFTRLNSLGLVVL